MKMFLSGMLLGLFCLSTLITARTAIADDPTIVSCPAVGNCEFQTILCSASSSGCTGVNTNDDSCVCAARYAAPGDDCGCGYWFP
jgi:hypothetical protein